MQVQECMRAPAVTCGPEAKIVEVARQMEWEDVGSVVVTDTDGGIVGIITDRDLVNAVARDLAASRPARDAMAGPVMVVHEHEDVYDAAAKMAAAHCRRLPVVNTAGKLVGVVAIDDMVGAFSHRTEARAGGNKPRPRSEAQS
jgi:signal-transduction protein with cAMP-binding, CBS, and nucleotidyltransferase domain